jgi:hypothetical protein
MIWIKSQLSRAIDLAKKRLELVGFSVDKLHGKPFHLEASAKSGYEQKKIRICLFKITEEDKQLIQEKVEIQGVSKEIWMKIEKEPRFEIFYFSVK